jgi:hypothetical protein
VGILGLFIKLALQTNQKLGLKSLQWVLLGDQDPLLIEGSIGDSPIEYLDCPI